MQAIHRVAWDGDVAAIDQLVQQDGRRLNAQIPGDAEEMDGEHVTGCSPLVLAAWKGHDAAVARLLALGADVGLKDSYGYTAAHWACSGDRASTLRMLLDAGASMTARNNRGRNPLKVAAKHGGTDCVSLLLARFGDGVGEQLGLADNNGNTAAHLACYSKQPSMLALLLDAGASMTARGNRGRNLLMAAAVHGATDCVALLLEKSAYALDLDVKQNGDWIALHLAASHGYHQAVSLLLHAGADPTIHDNRGGRTALQKAQTRGHHECIALLEAALLEPQRSRLLFKARALLDAAYATHKARSDAQTKGHPAPLQQQEAIVAAPNYLKQRMAQAQELPRVSIQDNHHDEEEQLAACLKYALGLEGGGGVVLFEGQEPAVRMLPEVLVELVELLVPKWDPACKGRPLGEGM